jgi:hypothetical protein
MARYKQIKFAGEISDLATPSIFNKVRQAFLDTHKENLEIYEGLLKAHSELVKAAIQVYGTPSNEVQYLRKRHPSKPPVNYQREFDKLIKKFEVWEEAEARRQKGREAYQRRKARLMEWTRILKENGYVEGKDFRWGYADKAAQRWLVEVEPGVWCRKEPLMLEAGVMEGEIVE